MSPVTPIKKKKLQPLAKFTKTVGQGSDPLET